MNDYQNSVARWLVIDHGKDPVAATELVRYHDELVAGHDQQDTSARKVAEIIMELE